MIHFHTICLVLQCSVGYSDTYHRLREW